MSRLSKKSPSDSYVMIAFDLETTDLFRVDDPCQIIEIYCEEKDNASNNFYSLVKAQKKITKGARDVHQIQDEELENAPTAAEILPQLFQWIADQKQEKVILIAHNCFGFDSKVLLAECDRVKLTLPTKVRFTDTLPAITTLFPYSSDEVEQRGGGRRGLFTQKTLVAKYVPKEKVDGLVAHRAKADVKMLFFLCEHVPDAATLYQFLLNTATNVISA